MAFDFTGLEEYTQQHADELVIASLFDAKTQRIIKAQGVVERGIKSSRTINQLTTDVTFQDDTCGFNPTDTTEVNQRPLTVGAIKINETLCQKDLNKYFLQEELKIGSNNDGDLGDALEEAYTTAKTGAIAEQNEVSIWKGDKASADANLNKYDGFIKIISQASGSVVHANAAAYISGAPLSSGTVITGDIAIRIVDGIYKALPAKIRTKKDIRVFCGTDFFATYIIGLKDKNYYHYAPENDDLDIKVPGTNMILTGVNGLDETNRLYGMRVSNMHLGTDLEGEDEEFKLWYSQDQDEVRFKCAFKLGVQIALPKEIVEFHLGA